MLSQQCPSSQHQATASIDARRIRRNVGGPSGAIDKQQRSCEGETAMHTPFRLSLVAGLSVAGVGAAAAQSDPCVWRYYVTNALHAQQAKDSQAGLLREGRASAVERDIRFVQHHERYFADGSLAPTGDTALR
jgi:hypothetical protein